MSKVILSEERLTLRTRALCGLGAVTVIPISALFVFVPGVELVVRVFGVVFLLIGLCLAFFTVFGRRSPFFEALIETLASIPG
jgi:hypothetical protein